MKTLDLKSLSLGVIVTLLFFGLTSSKSANDDNNIEVIPATPQFGLYNKSTRKVYIYNWSAVGKISEEPRFVYQIAPDGSSVSQAK